MTDDERKLVDELIKSPVFGNEQLLVEVIIEQQDEIEWLRASQNAREDLRVELAALKAEWIEWLCAKCNSIHPIQIKGKILQPCPVCNYAMLPTSKNMREIIALRAQLQTAQDEIKYLNSELLRDRGL